MQAGPPSSLLLFTSCYSPHRHRTSEPGRPDVRTVHTNAHCNALTPPSPHPSLPGGDISHASAWDRLRPRFRPAVPYSGPELALLSVTKRGGVTPYPGWAGHTGREGSQGYAAAHHRNFSGHTRPGLVRQGSVGSCEVRIECFEKLRKFSRTFYKFDGMFRKI